MIEVTKTKNFIYSMWIIPCGVSAFIASLLLAVDIIGWGSQKATMLALLCFVSFLYMCPIPVGYFIAAVTSKYRGAWSRFWGIVAGYFLLSGLSIGFSSLSLSNYNYNAICAVLGVLSVVYCDFCFILALRKRRSIVAQSVYAHSSEYKEKKNMQLEKAAEQKKAERQKKSDAEEQQIRAEHAKAIKEMQRVEGKSLKAMHGHKKDKVGKERVKSGLDIGKTDAVIQNTAEEKQKEQEVPKNEPALEIVDVNLCTEEDLLALPGMSVVIAHKAVEERKLHGEYQSVDDFIARNGIKPHIAVRFMELMKAELSVHPEPSSRRRRTLDL